MGYRIETFAVDFHPYHLYEERMYNNSVHYDYSTGKAFNDTAECADAYECEITDGGQMMNSFAQMINTKTTKLGCAQARVENEEVEMYTNYRTHFVMCYYDFDPSYPLGPDDIKCPKDGNGRGCPTI